MKNLENICNLSMKQVYDKKILDDILHYIKQDQLNCLYLYIDLIVYGLNNPNIHVWYDKDIKGIRMVVMQYHKSFQVYSSRAFEDVEDLLKLISMQKPYCISARQEIIKEIESKLPEYYAEYGVVVRHPDADIDKLKHVMNLNEVQIEKAKIEEAEEIAEFICSDDELGAPYTVESLTEELRERMRTGMGRSFIIRDNNKIVAHTATFAENEDYAIGGGLIVDKNYRDTDYFYYLDGYVKLLLKKEKKSLVGMILDKRLLRAYERKGCKVISHYGKLSLLDK